jgi:hypothetical protein
MSLRGSKVGMDILLLGSSGTAHVPRSLARGRGLA